MNKIIILLILSFTALQNEAVASLYENRDYLSCVDEKNVGTDISIIETAPGKKKIYLHLQGNTDNKFYEGFCLTNNDEEILDCNLYKDGYKGEVRRLNIFKHHYGLNYGLHYNVEYYEEYDGNLLSSGHSMGGKLNCSQKEKLTLSCPTPEIEPEERYQYQKGSERNRIEITNRNLDNYNAYEQKLAQITAYYKNKGTAFYVGQYQGQHIMMSNMHIAAYGKEGFCSNPHSWDLHFPLSDQYAQCKSVIASLSQIDVVFFSVKLKDSSFIKQLKKSQLEIDFNYKPQKDELLSTIGFGIYKNDQRKMKINNDSDCKIFSNQTRKREQNLFCHRTDSVWTSLHGCDASPGDSGSALMTRSKGKIIGLLTAVATHQLVTRVGSDSKALEQLNEDQLWNALNYSVPTFKIKEALNSYIDQLETTNIRRKVIEDLLK